MLVIFSTSYRFRLGECALTLNASQSMASDLPHSRTVILLLWNPFTLAINVIETESQK
jgi:hypothetical protein